MAKLKRVKKTKKLNKVDRKIKKTLEKQVKINLKTRQQLRKIKEKEMRKDWHKPVKQTVRATTRVMKHETGILTESAVSLRHQQYLVDPERPFTDNRGQAAHGLLSTAIVSYEYFPDRRMLVLTWWKDWKKKIVGSQYAYYNVPNWKYERLVRASSKGRYIYYNIRTTHPFKRLS